MTDTVDQTKDPGFSTLRILVDRFPGVLEFSKTANLKESEYDGLPFEAFADPDTRTYPIHTPEHTALSIGYSKLASVVPLRVTHALKQAAALHGIPEEIFAESAEKTAAVETGQYLLEEKKRFKVASAVDVPIAEQAFHSRYRELSIEDRTEMGTRLVKVAKDHGVSLHPSTQKLAGFTITSTKVLKDWVGAREVAAVKMGSAIGPAFQALADQYTDTEPVITDRTTQLKLASLISELDQRAGLTPFYGNKLPDPIRTVFNTDQLATDFLKVGSALQNKALLESLPLSFWEDTLGEDIAKEIAPNGEVDMATLEQILPTLPADLKSALESQLAAYNK